MITVENALLIDYQRSTLGFPRANRVKSLTPTMHGPCLLTSIPNPRAGYSNMRSYQVSPRSTGGGGTGSTMTHYLLAFLWARYSLAGVDLISELFVPGFRWSAEYLILHDDFRHERISFLHDKSKACQSLPAKRVKCIAYRLSHPDS